MGALDPRHVLAEAERAGLTLTPDGDRLVIEPKSRLTDELRARLRAVKPELLALLAELEQARRAGLCARAVEGLTDGRLRSAVLEPSGDGTCLAAVAVRMADGGAATAVLTGIRGDPFALLLAFERACELPRLH